MTTFNALIIHPDGTVEERRMSDDLDSMKAVVGGWLEAVALPEFLALMYMNEEGKLMGLEPNPLATSVAIREQRLLPGDVIAGTVLIVGAVSPTGEATGDTFDVPGELVSMVKDMAQRG